MVFQRGEIVLVPFPFTDLSTAKVRPAIVVSGSLYQSVERDLVLAAVTSNVAAATGLPTIRRRDAPGTDPARFG